MTGLGIYKILFTIELLVSFFVLAYRIKKKPLFPLRASACAVVALVISYLFPVFRYDAIYSSFTFLTLFVVDLFLLYFCYGEMLINIIFIGVAAYTTRHMAFQVFSLTESLITMFLERYVGLSNFIDPSYFYGNASFTDVAFGISQCISMFLYLNCYVITYLLTYMFFGRKLYRYEEFKIANKSLLFLSGFVLIAEIVLHAVSMYVGEGNDYTYVVIYVYNILSCLFIFFMQKSLINEKQLKYELDIVNHLLMQEKEQYESRSENIELINLKCHDIRHQIRESFQCNIDEAYLREIEKLINVYDLTVRTGNAELDVILTEKSFLCARNSITLSCIADGKALSFMDKADIYAFFGNLIDNAVEAVIKIPDPERRIIDLSVKENKKMLAINVKNCFLGEIKTDETGMPYTTKKQDGYHGYGLKSVRIIANKYGGDFSVSIKNGVFSANAVLFNSSEKSKF